jgi:hypothetical protein
MSPSDGDVANAIKRISDTLDNLKATRLPLLRKEEMLESYGESSNHADRQINAINETIETREVRLRQLGSTWSRLGKIFLSSGRAYLMAEFPTGHLLNLIVVIAPF